MTIRRVSLGILAAAALVATPLPGQTVNDPALRGVWHANTYRLADGPTYRVTGHIFFSERDWTVLFFVLDESGVAKRASAEGGRYTLQNNRLVFAHHYNLSRGDDLPGLSASPLRVTVNDPRSAPTEPSRIAIQGDRLTIYFPSGNSMEFTRG